MNTIVEAFQGMHVSPAKHSYAWLPRKCDYRTDTRTDRQKGGGQTDAGQSDPYVPLCLSGDTDIKAGARIFYSWWILSHIKTYASWRKWNTLCIGNCLIWSDIKAVKCVSELLPGKNQPIQWMTWYYKIPTLLQYIFKPVCLRMFYILKSLSEIHRII